MRKNVKEQIENFIELLGQAHDDVAAGITNGDYATAMQLLVECQDGAISIGTMIEEQEGECAPTVGILEEYCESVYQFHEALAQTADGQMRNTDMARRNQTERWMAALSDILERLRYSVQHDIKIKKEAVFLPYNAAMWDSMESVYLAAKEDEDWQVYVIPIPYYDKGADGSLQEMHYEADRFPESIPVTRYDAYDFEQRHPDMIFIHNPYDGSNYVTSVHPFFYSKNLKQYTDNLVYIPYFVLDEIHPGDAAAVREMEQFVTVPAIVHADTVIVQSENMRQIYVDVMSEYAGENTRFLWEKKILGLGSPKYDRVNKVRAGEKKLPEGWERILMKPDGSRKKVVFYNTSVVAMLTHRQRMLDKIKRVLELFRQKQDEVALIWRPHPLLQTTIQAMRPELEAEYMDIVKKYREEQWGIYDTTPDLDMAIGLCDAYYGDPSSVVSLCGMAGIPAMLQNPAV